MRLIDADALFEDCVFSSPQFEKGMREFIADAPTIDAVPRKAFDRILWENDVMREQLADIGKPFGEKMDDVVKVVRCKECRYFYKYNGDVGECDFHDWYRAEPTENDYCSKGERKNNV